MRGRSATSLSSKEPFATKTDDWAGLLALGSHYWLHLPAASRANSGMLQRSSPITAAGPQRICTVFPILLPDTKSRETPRSCGKSGDQRPRTCGLHPINGECRCQLRSHVGPGAKLIRPRPPFYPAVADRVPSGGSPSASHKNNPHTANGNSGNTILPNICRLVENEITSDSAATALRATGEIQNPRIVCHCPVAWAGPLGLIHGRDQRENQSARQHPFGTPPSVGRFDRLNRLSR